MNNLYIKINDKYMPISLDVASAQDLADKLILIRVGTDAEPANNECLEYVRKKFMDSEVLTDAMKRSRAASLLILPHSIDVEMVSRVDMEKKTICVKVELTDDLTDFPEIKNEIEKSGKNIVYLPLSLEEYGRTREITERARIRKQRNGGGADNQKK